jgi:hypothetical protein
MRLLHDGSIRGLTWPGKVPSRTPPHVLRVAFQPPGADKNALPAQRLLWELQGREQGGV